MDVPANMKKSSGFSPEESNAVLFLSEKVKRISIEAHRKSVEKPSSGARMGG